MTLVVDGNSRPWNASSRVPKFNISNNGRMPTAEERNARPWHRRIGLPYDW